MIIGITGYPASGKSTISNILKDYGFFIINSDLIGHEVLEELNQELVDLFGDSIFINGKIDRKKLADIVFKEEEKIKMLESIVHPYILNKIDCLIKAHKDVAIESALLFEMKLNEKCDFIWFINAKLKSRLERVKSRGWNLEELKRRECRMLKLEDINADEVIINDLKLEDMKEKIKKILGNIGFYDVLSKIS